MSSVPSRMPICFLLAFSLHAAEPVVDWDAAKVEILRHYQSILRINTSSPPGNETLVVNYLKEVLDREGISSQFSLSMEAVRKDGYVWGRGANDNKDCVTAGLMITVLLNRLHIPLDRDVLYLAEANEESTNPATHFGMEYLIREHWPDIEAEYALAEGGRVRSESRRVRFVEITATEKVPRRAKLVATGTSGHGSLQRRDNAIVHLSNAVGRIAAWEPPMHLNDVTRTLFERLATISPAEESARYNGLVDPQKSSAIRDYFADHDLEKYSILRTTSSPTILTAGFRQNVIPSQAEAMLDIRALPDEDMTKFYGEMERVISDPAVKIVPADPGRPYAPPSRLDTEIFRVLEQAQGRLYPNAITLPGMLTAATDLALLRAKGVQAYGVGPRFEGDEFAQHGPHSDVERLSEEFLHEFVQYLWHADVNALAADVTAAPEWNPAQRIAPTPTPR